MALTKYWHLKISFFLAEKNIIETNIFAQEEVSYFKISLHAKKIAVLYQFDENNYVLL